MGSGGIETPCRYGVKLTGSKKLTSNPRAVEWAAEGGLAGDGHRHRF